VKDLGKEMDKHLTVWAAMRVLDGVKERLQTASYRLLYNAKEADRGLPGEGKGFDDAVVSNLHRVLRHLEQASWELYRRWSRQNGTRYKGSDYKELPEKNPSETDWSSMLRDVKFTSVPTKVLRDVQKLLLQDSGELTAKKKKARVECLRSIDWAIEQAELKR